MPEIIHGVHLFEIPTPFPVGTVNSYLIEGEPLTLIDVGPQYPPAIEKMQEILSNLGYHFEDIEQILLTHGHIDHTGMAGMFLDARRSHGLKEPLIAIHSEDVYRLAYHNEYMPERMKAYMKIAKEGGAPEEAIAAINTEQLAKYFLSLAQAVPSIQTLSEGEILESGIGMLVVIWTPGHTRGSVCFAADDARLLFTGDHVLGDISSNPSLDFEGPGISMLTYLDSLDLILKYNGYRILPGHRMNVQSLRERVSELKSDIQRKLQQLLELLTDKPTSIYQLSRRLYGDYDVTQLVLALAETLDLARVLEKEGKARVIETANGKSVIVAEDA
ncbi:MAG: MBL fold metallo-hydrolase [Candidatus Thorarchaeota archaeon]|nr:MBL fold metallo-hydrolase [Candidatus Thorarchaeota archaeon]